MKKAVRALAAAGLLAGASITAFVVAGPAHADTQICDQYGSTTIGGKYVVMNNRWGTSAQQCINVSSTGFTIASQQGTGSTSGAPVSYPAVFYGCHYTNCSPGTNLPKQLSTISSVTSSISYNFVSGATYDASYDIWLDPSAKKDGVNQQEVMIWFNRQGSIQPIGSVVGNVTIGGKSWQVWTGSNGSNNVVSYVAPSAISSWSFSVLDFLNDVKTRGFGVTNSWYLTSIQAGFEPWIGGTGLAVTNFSAAVNGGTAPSQGTSSAPSNPGQPSSAQPSSPSNPGNGSASCKITYGTNVWNSGYTATVTVANTGSSAINGWKLGFNLPSGQAITGSWNANLSGTSGSISATNASYNGSIPAGGNTSFGFQGTYSGTFAKPGSFTLNGSTCSAA